MLEALKVMVEIWFAYFVCRSIFATALGIADYIREERRRNDDDDDNYKPAMRDWDYDF